MYIYMYICILGGDGLEKPVVPEQLVALGVDPLKILDGPGGGAGSRCPGVGDLLLGTGCVLKPIKSDNCDCLSNLKF